MKWLAPLPLLGLAGCLFVSDAERLEHTDADGDGVPASRDCDDQEAAVGMVSAERCDGYDNDCDGAVDEGLLPDEDGDGHGAAADGSAGCFVHWVSQAGDCDDTDSSVFPGAPERCDGRPNDCDSGWEPNDELGIVSWTGADGEFLDLSAAFAAGAVGAPAQISLPSTGTLTLCAADPAYAVRLVGTDVQDLSIVGVPIPRPGDPTGLAILNASDSAQAGGAAIEVVGEDWSLSVRGLRITGGQASLERRGGGLHLRGGRQASLRDLEITANLADESSVGGAGMDLEDVGRVSLLDSLVFGNTAGPGASGGGVLARGVDLRIDGVTFEDNLARRYGGAVMIEEGRLSMFRSLLSRNQGIYGGGGVFVGAGVDAFVYDTSFVANVGDQGGAAWIEGALSCFDSRDETTFVDQEGVFRGAVWALFEDGRGSFDGCSTAGAFVSGSTYPQAQITPDLFISSPSDPDGRYYDITGTWLYCSSISCNGDVEESSPSR